MSLHLMNKFCILTIIFIQLVGRIFLIVQAIAYLPKAVFQMIASEEDADIVTVFNLFDNIDPLVLPIILFSLPIIVFCGLG